MTVTTALVNFERLVSQRDAARKLSGDLAVGLDAHVGRPTWAAAYAEWDAASDEDGRLQRLVNAAHRDLERAYADRAGLPA